jgi:putative oxidoreductase
MFSSKPIDARFGITGIRVVMGVMLFLAGLTKWLGGIGGTIGFFGQLGIPAPQVVAPVIATGELIGGLLLIVGLGSRPVALWFVCEFLVTALYVKLGRGSGWDAARIDLLILAGSAAIALVGGGRFALDDPLARRRQVRPRVEPVPVASTH